MNGFLSPGLITKIMVETDNAMDFRPRKTHTTGNYRHTIAGYETKTGLDLMQ